MSRGERGRGEGEGDRQMDGWLITYNRNVA